MNIWQTLKNEALMAGALCATASNLTATPFSDLSFEAACKQARQQHKIVLVDFYTTWCGPCKLLDQNTWTDRAVIRLLEQKTVPLRIDAEKETDLSKRYKIEAYPSVLLIKSDGTEIDRLVGYKKPKEFMADFNAALNGKDSISRARDRLLAAGTNNPSARMQFANALAQKGRDADALAEYLWCYDHGLEASRSFVSVRSSFLLMYLKNLAAHYAPARQALETRRDEREAKVAAGSTDLQTIQDLVSLNEALGQEKKDLTIFDQLPTDSRTRKLLAPMLTDEFLQAKRYSDVLHGTDGKSVFEDAVGRFHWAVDSRPKDDAVRKRLEESLRRFTVTTGARYFEALAGLKRNRDAKDLAELILKFDASPATRKSLAAAANRAGNTALAQYVAGGR